MDIKSCFTTFATKDAILNFLYINASLFLIIWKCTFWVIQVHSLEILPTDDAIKLLFSMLIAFLCP